MPLSIILERRRKIWRQGASRLISAREPRGVPAAIRSSDGLGREDGEVADAGAEDGRRGSSHRQRAPAPLRPAWPKRARARVGAARVGAARVGAARVGDARIGAAKYTEDAKDAWAGRPDDGLLTPHERSPDTAASPRSRRLALLCVRCAPTRRRSHRAGDGAVHMRELRREQR